MKVKYLLSLLFALSCTLCQEIMAQCNDDTTPPVAICEANMLIQIAPGEVVTLLPSEIDEGSYDECSDVSLTIGFAGGPTPPEETSLTIGTFGTFFILLGVTDESGNSSVCFTEVVVLDNSCNDDQTTPTMACNTPLTYNLGVDQAVTIDAEELDANSTDNCYVELDFRINEVGTTTEPPTTTSITLTGAGTYQLVLWGIDGAGNYSNCWSEIIVTDEDCADNTIAPEISCNSVLQITLSPATLDFVVHPDQLISSVSDDCSTDFTYGLALELDEENPPSVDSLVFDTPGVFTVYTWVADENGNWAYCETEVIVREFEFGAVFGRVSADANNNCLYDAGETRLPNWNLEMVPMVDGQPAPDEWIQEATTDENGEYKIEAFYSLLDQYDSLQVKILPNIYLGQGCPIIKYVQTEDILNGPGVYLEFSVELDLVADCPAMQVDIASPFIRRCADNTYTVNYCNYGAVTAEDAYVEVILDPYIEYLVSSIIPSEINDSLYTFPLGDVAPGDCGSFIIFTSVSCDAVLGQTHCTSAYIYPDSLCDDNYNGPVVELSGSCDTENQEVKFRLTNVGQSDMLEPLNYLVVEDVIMYIEQEPFQLDVDESIDIVIPANGATFRMEAEQPDDYPLFPKIAATVEGCSEDGTFNQGMVTQFSQFEAGNFESIDCQENIGSYDPNDKQASPRGIGEGNYIPKNTPIDYRIRFQNTGTDTAFQVVIIDTLSEWLNQTTIRPGASSHEYSFQFLSGNVVEFRFDNILLPDSTTNLEESVGFVQFEIQQLPDNPDGTNIDNTAAIYFDSNEPIITNLVSLTVGQPFIIVNVDEAISAEKDLKAYPNPLTDVLNIELAQSTSGLFHLYDRTGQLVLQQNFEQAKFQVRNTSQLTSGLYFFEIRTTNGNRYSGKLIVK